MNEFLKNLWGQLKARPVNHLIITALVCYILFDRFMEKPKSVEAINDTLVKTKEAQSRIEDAEWLIVDLRNKQRQLAEVVEALSSSNRASLKTVDAINQRYTLENDSLRRSVELRSKRIINQLTQPK